MAIKIKTIDGGTVQAVDDARLYEMITMGLCGPVEGVQITHQGGLQLLITGGWGLALGRCWSIDEQTLSVRPATGGTQKGRLLLRLDIRQQRGELTTQVGTSLPPLVQERINYDGGVYEVPLATYSVTELALSQLDVTDSVSMLPLTATFRHGAWAQSGSKWTQTVPCAGMQAASDYAAPWINKTGVKSTDEELQDALSQLAEGWLEPLDGQMRATVYAQPPSCDIEIRTRRVS